MPPDIVLIQIVYKNNNIDSKVVYMQYFDQYIIFNIPVIF